MPPTFALLVIGLIALPALVIGAVIGSVVTVAYLYRRQLLELIRRDSSKSDKIKLDIKRAFWGLVLGSLVVAAGSIGAIRAVYADDFWAQQGWFILAGLGFMLVIWGFWRGLKSN